MFGAGVTEQPPRFSHTPGAVQLEDNSTAAGDLGRWVGFGTRTSAG